MAHTLKAVPGIDEIKAYATVKQVHAAYNAGKLTPSELTERYLKRAEGTKTGAYLQVLRDRAMAQAKAHDAVLKREGKVPPGQPLFGIPLGIKDVLTMDGVRTTCGSRMLENYVPPYTGTAVERLERAGAISLGKLNMDEFAMGSSNENSAFGPVNHPTHPDRVPGGSSGGSGAAVRAGLCVGALGTDTGGSIRLPASYCGIVGLKVTYGRVSRFGLVAFSSSLDSIGPMTHTVEDSARILQAMGGFDPRDSTSADVPMPDFIASANRDPDWSKVRVGVPKEYFIDGIDPEVRSSVQRALDWYKSKGAKLVDVSLPHTKYAVATYYVVAVSEASSNLARFDGVRFGLRPGQGEEDLTAFYKKNRTLFGPEVKRRIILGTFALSSGYYDAYFNRACQVRAKLKEDFDRAFEKCDVIACPVAPTTAFKRGEKTGDPLQMYLMDIFTIPASMAGMPGISIPCGADKDGLSIGLQLIAPQFQEERLFSFGAAFEKAHPEMQSLGGAAQ
ncbi:MAG: Asp-tRNA(Asn)/Glu-tRNA(Gln) amidotransferase subunit GatA [Bdellovibrionales bacterium]|nr:Asp-tRNA(Asn)/Glu-tRNA(Gln) amidotransferase subunit GatA [Bdellovibrionales bacterium]